MMDVDYLQAPAASNMDDWLPRFSPATGSRPGAFPFSSRKTQSIESRRARMSDLLIFDVLLIRGGIRGPDMLFPPVDWASLRKLLEAINESAYDVLKKDCLVYILLKWAWDFEALETNPGWDVRYLQDRCIAPQFAVLADAYWLLDTGTHLSKAVSILSDARLNRDYVSKILQALSLSSSPTSSTSGVPLAAATLVVKYVRTAKPLLTEPDDIDLYALSLAQLSFMDAWAYQRSFHDGSDTRERLLGKMIAWCLTPTPKQGPLAQLIAFSLSLYEQSYLYSFALPSQLPTSSLSGVHVTSMPSRPSLSSQAMLILQDLLCVRAIQSGDYVRAIMFDRQFSSVFSSSDSSSSISSQVALPVRDTIDRKSIIQDLFVTLPPAERALLEDEIGKVATGVRVNTQSTFTPKQGISTRRPLVAEPSLSASWEDLGASQRMPVPSVSASASPPAVSTGFASKATAAPVSTASKVSQPTLSASGSPLASHVPRSAFGRQAPPTPKFTAFGSPIPSATGVSAAKGVVVERVKTLFSDSATGGPSGAGKSAPRISLFDTTGSAKKAPNAFYKPPSAPAAKASVDVGSALASSGVAKNLGQDTIATKQNGKTLGGENGDEDVSMGSGSDVEIVEEGRRNESGRKDEEGTDEDEEDAGDFLTYDTSGAADLTFHTRHVDEMVDEDHEVGAELVFSVFSGSRNAMQNGNGGGHGKRDVSENERVSYVSPSRRTRVSPSREGDKSLNASTTSSRPRAPPGAFHPEEEDQHDENANEDNEEDNHALQTTPIQSPRRSTRTRRQSETPPRSILRSPSQRNSKNATTTGSSSRPPRRSGRTSSRQNLRQSIPGALMDDDNDEHEQDDADHTDAHGDVDTEVDEQEEDDAIAPLPSHHTSRRTRGSEFLGVSIKSKSSAKPTAPAKAAATTNTTAKGKRPRASEPKTPTRRSSRLSMASPTSPDHNDIASPIKGRKSTGSRASIAGSGSGAVATRSNAKRMR